MDLGALRHSPPEFLQPLHPADGEAGCRQVKHLKRLQPALGGAGSGCLVL